MNAWHTRKAIKLLRQGAVVAYPTETVWGFGCIPIFSDALYRILQIKQRSVDKGVILVGTEIDQFEQWILPLTTAQKRRLVQPSERPTTWIVPASTNCPYWISGGRQTLAVRISAHPVISNLCNAVGALVSTSANRAGKPTKSSRSECLVTFGRDVDWVLPGDSNSTNQPSKIIELITGNILRD